MFLFVGEIGRIGTVIIFLTQRIISCILTKLYFVYLTGNDRSQKLRLNFFFFFYRYITTHTFFKNIKTLSPGTNILEVLGKKQKEIPN